MSTKGALIGPPCTNPDGSIRLRYTPAPPHPKQAAFLATTCDELFFGGSGGPGKSFALLAAALQFADVPGYSALILRRSLTDLKQKGALIEMSHVWLDDTDAVYNANDRKWTFPSGAVLQFGYLAHESHLGNYRGAEYHFIGWDELGEFPEEDHYTFLFSRLRRPKNLTREQIIRMYGESPDGLTLLDIPLRVRSASNPGGPGMEWVKRRFVDKETREAPYLPAKYTDNPAIDPEEYEAALSKLSPIERRRMGDGDWDIQEIPGALWTLDMIQRVEWEPIVGDDGDDLLVDVSMFETVAMAIDPSVGEGAGDECGITIGGQYADRRVVVLADLSQSAHPDVWSVTAVTNYHRYGCSKVVVEQNQGVELLRTQINNAADKLGVPRPVIELVNARGSKEARAATIQQAYVSTVPMMTHIEHLRGSKLEAQMVGWVPGQGKSPDRVDAVVWLGTALLYPQATKKAKPATAREKLMSWNA